MANRNLDDVSTIGKGIVTLAGRFVTDAAGAVTSQVPATTQGAPFTVTKPAATTGQYLITLNDPYPDFYSAVATGMKAAGANVYKVDVAAVDTSAVPATVTLQVHDATSGNAADPNALTVGFVLTMKNSTVYP